MSGEYENTKIAYTSLTLLANSSISSILNCNIVQVDLYETCEGPVLVSVHQKIKKYLHSFDSHFNN